MQPARLYQIQSAINAVVALNRAVAVARVEEPDAALSRIDRLDLSGYHLFPRIRADLLRRLGRNAEAALAYEAAIVCTANATERDFLERSLSLCHCLRRTPTDVSRPGYDFS